MEGRGVTDRRTRPKKVASQLQQQPHTRNQEGKRYLIRQRMGSRRTTHSQGNSLPLFWVVKTSVRYLACMYVCLGWEHQLFSRDGRRVIRYHPSNSARCFCGVKLDLEGFVCSKQQFLGMRPELEQQLRSQHKFEVCDPLCVELQFEHELSSSHLASCGLGVVES